MGYLRQKKQQKRENIFLAAMMVMLAALTALSFTEHGIDCKYFNLFHLFCLASVLMIYSLWRKKFKSVLVFAFLLLISYTSLAAYANIFLSDKFEGQQILELSFNKKQKLSDTLDKENIKAAGTIILAQHYKASYAVVEHNTPITLIQVDFSNASLSDYPLIFRHLNEFIAQNDNPVIIFGEFGIPAWSKSFKNFIETSNLSVKNRLLFNPDMAFDIFSIPGFYVLGFKEMGIIDLDVVNANNTKNIKFLVSFNPEKP